MRAAEAASSSLMDRGGSSAMDMLPQMVDGVGVASRGGVSDYSQARGSRGGRSRVAVDDDDVKLGLRRTFSNSSCGSFSSDVAFKSEALGADDQFMLKDLPNFDRRRSHMNDVDDVPLASNLGDSLSKPSPLLLPQGSPLSRPMLSPPLLTSPNTFLSVPTP
jgi:hypothetical protein